jgi:hypothetical protein
MWGHFLVSAKKFSGAPNMNFNLDPTIFFPLINNFVKLESKSVKSIIIKMMY